MKPIDFWTMRGCLMPIAVCSVDFGLSRRCGPATRRGSRAPSSVMTSAQPAKNRVSSGAATAANAAASVKPDAPPSRM